MKITRVEPILIAVPYEHGGPKPMRPLGPWTHMETLFVRIDTDAGWVGWGEAFPIFPHRKIGHSPQIRVAITAMIRFWGEIACEKAPDTRDYCDDSISGESRIEK